MRNNSKKYEETSLPEKNTSDCFSNQLQSYLPHSDYGSAHRMHFNKKSLNPQVQQDMDEPSLGLSESSYKIESTEMFEEDSRGQFVDQSLILQSSEDLLEVKKLFSKAIKLKLLYRASQNNFDVQNFHRACDGYRDTLTICSISQGNIILGYSPVQWDDQFNEERTHFKTDFADKAFLYNFTLKEKYDLVKVSKNNAIVGCQYLGPTFGNYDFSIGNKANIRYSSQSHFPSSFQHPSYPEGSFSLLTGTKYSYFQIYEWEVFQVNFGEEMTSEEIGEGSPTNSKIQRFLTNYTVMTRDKVNDLTKYLKNKVTAFWDSNDGDDF